MNLDEFISGVRDHGFRQYEDFVARQETEHGRYVAEVKFRLPSDSGIFGQMYVVDGVVPKDDGPPKVIEMYPDAFLRFDPIELTIKEETEVKIDGLAWSGTQFVIEDKSTDVAVLSRNLEPYFDYWLDPEERRFDSNRKFGGIIHSMLLQDNVLGIDFGSAEVEAFWAVLDVLHASGATKVRVQLDPSIVGEPNI